ncbi:MAG: hypothetical protein Q7S92_02020 [Candidatus Diapherotrites archaeon]|nr:hypothetical protein [Candidatus Diapherotrites archaeon]
MDNETTVNQPNKSKFSFLKIVFAIAIIAAVFFVLNNSFNFLPNPTGNISLTETQNNSFTGNSPLLRQTYFQEAFKPKREGYKLFEQASKNLNITLETTPAYFGLQSEQDIFADLPAVPDDFSEIAYLLANGQYFGIGQLEEEYYLQPEFYPNFKEQALQYWAKPNADYWGVTGYGTYPAEQWDILYLNGRKEFTAVVFLHTGWNVQTWQGLKLVPNAEAVKNFDLTITPNVILLGPTFPKFDPSWAQKIIIKGKLKPNTRPGNYTIGINMGLPPVENKAEWQIRYKNLYFDAASGIGPSGNQIQLNLQVKEKE